MEDFTFPSGCKCYKQASPYTYRWELARTEQREETLTDLPDTREAPREQNTINVNINVNLNVKIIYYHVNIICIIRSKTPI